MKKVLVAGAALLLAGGIVSEASAAAAVTPGVTITGNARARRLPAMMAPETVSLRWKVLVSIRGTMLSYSCQNAQMERNARPTRIVRLLLSFIAEISHSVFEKSRRRGVLRPAAQVFLFLNKFTLFARFIQPKI